MIKERKQLQKARGKTYHTSLESEKITIVNRNIGVKKGQGREHNGVQVLTPKVARKLMAYILWYPCCHVDVVLYHLSHEMIFL